MSRVRPVLAALLLVVAGAVPAAVATGTVSAPVEPADDPVVGVSENTTRVLLLTNADAAAFQSPNATVTNALAGGHADLTAEFRLEQLDRRLSRAGSPEAQRAILQNATDWAAERAASLREKQRAARAAFNAGEMTAKEYVLTLGTLHLRATSLQSFIGLPNDERTAYMKADSLGSETSQSRLRVVYAQTAALTGPVTEQVADVITGRQQSLSVHVTAGNGVMLSTIVGNTYLRQTRRPDNVDETTEQVGVNTALAYEGSLYPWARNHTATEFSANAFGEYAYRFTILHEHGRIVAYFDSSTKRVFVERQEKKLAELPVVVAASTTANGTTLNVSRTYAGGPLNVRVTNATGALVDTPIYVNGTRVGTTGSDGELWTISPAGEYNVTTTRNGTDVGLNVTAAPAP